MFIITMLYKVTFSFSRRFKIAKIIPLHIVKKYAIQAVTFILGDGRPIPRTYSNYIYSITPTPDSAYGMRRVTFADAGWLDSVPMKHSSTGEVIGSRRGPVRTFQVRPRPEDVDPHRPQSSLPGGLDVAFFDGSVRTISEGVSEATFWSMVTHNGGETVGDE